MNPEDHHEPKDMPFETVGIAEVEHTVVPRKEKSSLVPLLLAGFFTLLFLSGISLGVFKPEYLGFTPVKPQQTVQETPIFPTPTPVPHAGWLTYTSDVAGFSLLYPPDTDVTSETKNAKRPVLSISVEKISDIPLDLPLGMSRSDALEDKAALEKRMIRAGGYAMSNTLLPLGVYNGRESLMLTGLEVCTVMFTRSVTFYPREFRVTLSYTGVSDSIFSAMPDFFKKDNVNCGGQTVWNPAKLDSFIPDLRNKKGVGEAQVWYDTFDEITKTISFADGESTPTAVQQQ